MLAEATSTDGRPLSHATSVRPLVDSMFNHMRNGATRRVDPWRRPIARSHMLTRTSAASPQRSATVSGLPRPVCNKNPAIIRVYLSPDSTRCSHHGPCLCRDTSTSLRRSTRTPWLNRAARGIAHASVAGLGRHAEGREPDVVSLARSTCDAGRSPRRYRAPAFPGEGARRHRRT